MRNSKRDKEQVFRCKAEHYKGDKPHFWYHSISENRQLNYYPDRGERMGNRRVVTCAEHTKPVPMTAESLAIDLVLEGFTNTVETDTWGKESNPVCKVSGDGIVMKMIFWPKVNGEKLNSYTSRATGHTTFTSAKGERSFDRTGVEDSFYVNYSDTVETIKQKLLKQIERVKATRERLANMIDIPGIPFLTTTEGKQQISASLKSGRSHHFTPSGFGTGYLLYSSRQKSRYDERAKPETEEFFGISPIFIQKTDCD